MLLQRRQGWFWERGRHHEQVAGRVPSLPRCHLRHCLRGGSVLCSLSHLPARPLCASSQSRGGRGDGALFFQEGNGSWRGREPGLTGHGGGSRRTGSVRS